MPDDPDNATAQEMELELEIRRFETEVVFRQSNVLPLDAAINQGRFYGLIIRAARPKNGIERVGYFLFGFMWVAGVVSGLPLSVIFVPLGLKLIWTAFRELESNAL